MFEYTIFVRVDVIKMKEYKDLVQMQKPEIPYSYTR